MYGAVDCGTFKVINFMFPIFAFVDGLMTKLCCGDIHKLKSKDMWKCRTVPSIVFANIAGKIFIKLISNILYVINCFIF